VCADVCVSVGKARLVGSEQFIGYLWRAPSRRGLLSGLALTVAVCCTSQWPAKSIHLAHAGTANNLDIANQGVSNGQFIEDAVKPSFFLPGIISLSSCV